MNQFIVLIASSVLLASVEVSSSGLRLRGAYISQPAENYESSIGQVSGVRPCGGPGKVISWRVEGCSEDENSCTLAADELNNPTELEFIPSQDIESLGIRLVIHEPGDSTRVYEKAIVDSDVVGGTRYIVHGGVRVSKQDKGKTLTVQYILFQHDSGVMETCVEADFKLY